MFGDSSPTPDSQEPTGPQSPLVRSGHLSQSSFSGPAPFGENQGTFSGSASSPYSDQTEAVYFNPGQAAYADATQAAYTNPAGPATYSNATQAAYTNPAQAAYVGSARPAFANVQGRPVRPEQLIRRNSAMPSGSLMTKLRYLWRTDPAYRVLFVAIGTVLLSGVVCALLIGNVFGQSSTPTPPPTTHTTGTVAQNNTPVPTATPTTAPTPTATPVPTDTPTPTVLVVPTPTTPAKPTTPPVTGGPLTVQITNIPTSVQNNTSVTLTVHASVPGSTVRYTATYNAVPFFSASNTKTTDAAGDATFTWKVAVTKFGHGKVTAQLAVFAQDQAGHTATQNYSVEITQ